MSKSCGDCGLCCKLMGVQALNKPPVKWCVHFRRASGCGIYQDRPTDCRVFNCLWLLADDRLGEAWKPTVAGFLMHSEDEGRRLIVECDPAAPQAWRKEPYHAAIRRWADAGQEVLVFAGRRGLRLQPFGGETPVTRKSA